MVAWYVLQHVGPLSNGLHNSVLMRWYHDETNDVLLPQQVLTCADEVANHCVDNMAHSAGDREFVKKKPS